MIKEALKAVIGVGKRSKDINITPLRILIFAFLVAFIFLGTVASLLMLMHVKTDYVAGLTLGADPLVSGVALVSALDNRLVNGLIVRKEPKGHGTQAWIEGLLPRERTNITVLEDVITTGGSAIKAVEKLRDAGYVVNRVVSIIDRQEDGEADAAMKEADLELISIFKLDELTDENE